MKSRARPGLAVVFLLTTSVFASEDEIRPPHVFAKVTDCQNQIEQIRLEMGKPENLPLGVEVNDAEPREVYYQALTLFTKANRLSYDLTRTDATAPAVPTGPIEPKHVFTSSTPHSNDSSTFKMCSESDRVNWPRPPNQGGSRPTCSTHSSRPIVS